MLMRVSLGIHLNDIEAAFETYDGMSNKLFTHATPTLFNSGTNKPQLSSCFLLTTKRTALRGSTIRKRQTTLISQSAGGIGLSIHNIRAKGSFIKGTNGTSNGIVPMLKVLTILQDMSTKAVVSAKAHLRFILNLGMPIFMISWK